MKLLTSVFIILQQINDEGIVLSYGLFQLKEVRSRRYEIHNVTDLQDTLNNAAADIELQIARAHFTNAKLQIIGIDKIVINYDRFNPTRGASYIELPKHIADKKTCINRKNEDNKCFKYSVQCGFYKTYEEQKPTRNTSLHTI